MLASLFKSSDIISQQDLNVLQKKENINLESQKVIMTMMQHTQTLRRKSEKLPQQSLGPFHQRHQHHLFHLSCLLLVLHILNLQLHLLCQNHWSCLPHHLTKWTLHKTNQMMLIQVVGFIYTIPISLCSQFAMFCQACHKDVGYQMAHKSPFKHSNFSFLFC